MTAWLQDFASISHCMQHTLLNFRLDFRCKIYCKLIILTGIRCSGDVHVPVGSILCCKDSVERLHMEYTNNVCVNRNSHVHAHMGMRMRTR